MGAPRGIRNNNPGNIRLSSDTWVGQVRPGTDTSFCQFVDLEHGFRALFKLIENYAIVHKLRTITQIISRWAPEKDGNLTKKYIADVSRWTGIAPDVVIDVNDKRTMCKIAEAICREENGRKVDMSVIERGWLLAR